MSTTSTTKQLLALGTTSTHKITATTRAVTLVGMTHLLRVQEVPGIQSGVPEQPVGLNQTFQGAINRARRALAELPEAAFGLGIESGLMNMSVSLNGKGGADYFGYIDLAAVVLINRASGAIITTTSNGIPINPKFVSLSLASKQAKTAGAFMAEASGADAKDWHSHLTGGFASRVSTVEQAVSQALVIMFPRTK